MAWNERFHYPLALPVGLSRQARSTIASIDELQSAFGSLPAGHFFAHSEAQVLLAHRHDVARKPIVFLYQVVANRIESVDPALVLLSLGELVAKHLHEVREVAASVVERLSNLILVFHKYLHVGRAQVLVSE